MSAMDQLFITMFQQLHQHLLLVDEAGVIRFASGLLAEFKPGLYLPEVMPDVPVNVLDINTLDLQGPVRVGLHGDFFYQVIPLFSLQFNGYGLVFQQRSDHAALQKSNERMQQLLFQAEKMAVIGQFTTSITHEINNPIGYVYSNLHTLSEYIDNLIHIIESLSLTDNSAQQAAIKEQFDFNYICQDIRSMLQESGFGLEQVITQIAALKDLSHTDELTFQLTDIQPGILSCINIVHNEVKYKATIHKELAVLPMIECIPSQLYQVILNLLVNAGHAIKDRGEISFRTGVAEQWVWIEVEDSGSGINKEHLPQIFDPFFTTKAVGKGTGLGLAISKSIIEHHHGRCEVRSQLDVGTCFKVWLPIQQPESAANH